MKAKSRLLRCVVLAVSALVVLGVALFAACGDSGNTTEPDAPATVTGVTLSDSKLELIYGKTGSLTATVKMSDNGSYGGEYSWSSSDEDIVSVSGDSKTAALSANGVGGAIVTVETEEKSASCTVTVVAAVTDISLSSESLELVIGGEETATLNATVETSDESEYGGAYVWSSDDDSVAEVDGGDKEATVTAANEGTATITVTAQDMSASCRVTVTEPEPDGPAGYLVYAKNSDGGYTVTGVKEDYTDSIDEVLIPDIYKRAPVTAIAESAFEDLATVESVTIGENVASIGAHAFSGCTSIAEIRYDAARAEDLSAESCVFENIGTYCDEATVTIGSGVERIPAYLFYNTDISEVVFEDGCKCESLGKYSFAECASLGQITIPESVVDIGEGTFDGCTGAESIYFDAANMDDVAAENMIFSRVGLYCDETSVIIGADVENIPANLFYSSSDAQYAPNMESVRFEEDGACESVGERSFAYCASLTDIGIPDGVKSIGEACFEGCSGLESMTLPFVGGSLDAAEASRSTLFGYIFGTTRYDGGTSANQHFRSGTGSSNFVTYCVPISLTEVVITGGQLFYGAFEECYLLRSISIPDVTAIEDKTFLYCLSLEDITIPESVTSIGDEAFGYCASLESITIPDSVKSIGEYLFESCMSLNDVTIGGGLKEISNYMFCFCTALEEITIPSNITTIGYLAFYGCTALKSLTIPSSVGTVGSYAFLECASLESVTIEEGNNIYFEGGAFYYCTSLRTVSLGEGMSRIGEGMFMGCASLESVVIPDSVTRVGTYAFYGCSGLKSLTIGKGVKTFDYYSFYGCTALTEINYNATAASDLWFYNYVFYRAGIYGGGITLTIGANVTRMPAYLFCPDLSFLNYPPKITAIIFENGSVCASIGEYCFYPCSSLTTLVFPASIMYVEYFSFGLCSYLNTIYYCGTEEEWSGIFFASSIVDGYYLNRATKYWYSEDDPQDSNGKYWHYDDDWEIAVW